MKVRMALLGSALLLTSLAYPQVSQDFSSTFSQTPPTRGQIAVPFKLYRDYLIVTQGSLGGLEGMNFLIDTGADPSTVDRRIARKLGLKGKAGKLALFQGKIDVESVVLPSVQLGPIQTDSLPGFIEDLRPVGEAIGVRIDAIVGFGALSMRSFIIDYKSRKIIFAPFEPSPLAVPFEINPPTLTAQIQDQPVRLLVDTGASDLLLFECRLQGRLRLMPAHDERRFLNAAETQFEATEVRLSVLRLGLTDLRVRKAFLVDDRENCGLSFDGVVGVPSLGLKWIAFDFEHRRFSWKR